MSEQQLTIDYPPDLELLNQVIDRGVLIASPRTERFSAMDALVEMGLLKKTYCPRAGKVYQFEATSRGREYRNE